MQSPRMGESRNMETKTRTSPEGAVEDVRRQSVPGASGGASSSAGLPRGDSVAMSDALTRLSPRELVIFNAGMAAGAAQQLAQMVGQHSEFLKAATSQLNARHSQATKLLTELPEASAGARAGVEVAHRVMAVGKALLGKK
jgi:hypothetical protein